VPRPSRVEAAEHLPGVGQAAQPAGSDDTLTRADDGALGARLDPPAGVVVPVVLPQVVVTVDETGHARIAVENIGHHDAIDCPDRPVGRDELGAVLASIAEQIGGPVRVEVREPDGSRYADILQPRPPEPAEYPEQPETPAKEPLLTGGGFLADETVLVAVVVATTQAQADGTASLTALRLPARSGGEIILFGGASGRIVQRRVPVRPRFPGRRWWRR
jgi:hypothetical protein